MKSPRHTTAKEGRPTRCLRHSANVLHLRMAAAQPADRFGSMAEVVEALEGCEFLESSDPAIGSAISSQPSDDNSIMVRDELTSCVSASSLVLAGVSFLLVEHSRLQTHVIKGLMAELGAELVRTATSGQAAWEAILSERPDVVISSMHLPDITGADLVTRMRSDPQAKDVAFVLISSETDYEFLEPVRQSGTAAILSKPFDAVSLRQALLAAADFSPHAV